APIAGKVVKVSVAVGDHVAPGGAVIVLEAMKMENELAAERGGTVSAIHKAAGQAVDTGDLLVEIA
ncbi:MAG TPA: biotin/lipoyl-containing protein, partial [Kofleriaceae bacterium]